MSTFTAHTINAQVQTCSTRSSFCGRKMSAPRRAAAFVHTRPKAVQPVQAMKKGYSVTIAEPVNDKGQIKIDATVSGDVTQSEFTKTLKELGTSSPVIPGFRKKKGNANVPSKVLLQMLGKKRVYGFLIQSVVTNTLVDFTEEEGLDAEKEADLDKDNEKLMDGFEPGKPISFQATLQLKGLENATTEGDAATVTDVTVTDVTADAATVADATADAATVTDAA